MVRNKFIPVSVNESLTVRLLDSGDVDNLIEIFDALGAESRYRRFLQSVDNLSQTRIYEEAENIIALLPEKGNGLIAFQEGAPVGAARYVRIDDTTAEIAISVIDDAQGKGIGSHLLPLLTELAYEDGLTTLVGTVSNDNEPTWRLLNKLPYKLTRYAEGNASSFTLDLMPSW